METIQQMKNLDELKERIQDDIQNWHRNLEGENQYPHLNKVIYEGEDLNKLLKIVTDRINELEDATSSVKVSLEDLNRMLKKDAVVSVTRRFAEAFMDEEEFK